MLLFVKSKSTIVSNLYSKHYQENFDVTVSFLSPLSKEFPFKQSNFNVTLSHLKSIRWLKQISKPINVCILNGMENDEFIYHYQDFIRLAF